MINIELHELITAIGGKTGTTQNTNEGSCIVVIDRGFVYQGRVTVIGDWVYIENAQNVRVWGTTKGIGELAISGPTANTKLDKCGSVKTPLRALIALLPCKTQNW
jgi:hypothetical protein